jgi:rubrerythrin
MYASSTAIARTRHFIYRIKTNGKKRNLARLCKVCNETERSNAELSAQKRKRPGHETVYECQVCNVSLCIEPCFRLFHSKKNGNI